MFPREFVEWMVKDCWYNVIDNTYGMIVDGKDKIIGTLDELYYYWITEIIINENK